MILVLALAIAVLYGTGTYLLLQRNLMRVLLGLVLLGHGANLLLLLSGGAPGTAPVLPVDPQQSADPLPQALALTSIVITFGVSAFLLLLVYENVLSRSSDEVEDEAEDVRDPGRPT